MPPRVSEPEAHELSAFRRAVLDSELSRVTWMLGVYVLFVLLGLYRIVRPSADGEGVGPLVLAIAGAYLLLELVILAYLRRRRIDGRPVAATIGRTHSTLECLFPVVAAGAVLAATPLSPYTVLVSPAYGFIFILLSLSVLRLDVTEAVITGVLGTAGYGALVAFVFATNDVAATSPHPPLLYINLTLLLLIATGVIAFITGRVRRYVMASIQEAETRRQRDLLQRDLEVAGAIQRGLLPDSVPSLEGYDIAAISEPADQAGGDYFDWEVHGDDRCLISLADVTGHGVGPALVTAACRAYVRATTGSHVDPSSLLQRVNALVHADSTDGRFVTFALLERLRADVREFAAGTAQPDDITAIVIKRT